MEPDDRYTDSEERDERDERDEPVLTYDPEAPHNFPNPWEDY